MKLEINLRRALEELELDKHGRVGELAKATGLHRHTVRGLMDGTATSIKMEALDKLCRWLLQNGKDQVRHSQLPQILFQYVHDDMWAAVEQTGDVTIAIPQYEEEGNPPAPPSLWVNRRDIAVANAIEEEVTLQSDRQGERVRVHRTYVPFRYARSSPRERQQFCPEDTRKARRIYEQLPSRKGNAATVLIGSPEVCYAVECFMVNVLKWDRPFERPENRPVSPVWFKSRHPGAAIVSCFGTGDPPGMQGQVPPGIYYLDKAGQWVGCPRIEGRQEAGLVITSWDTAANAIEIAIFGVSGRATEAMVKHVVREADRIWPPYYVTGRMRYGIYVCKFTLDPDADQDMAGELPVEHFEPIRVEGEVLKNFI